MNGLQIIFESCFTDVVSILVATAIGCLLAKARKLQFIGWLVLYVIVDDVIALLPIVCHWNIGTWNWIGQTASLAFALFVAYRFFSKEEIGMRLPSTRAEIFWTIAGICAALAVAIGPALTGSGNHPNLETFAYEATLPGPVEELVFRGIGMALLIRAFSVGAKDRRAEWIAVLVTAVWFTSGHVLHLEDGKFLVLWSRVLDVFPMAIVYGVTRLRSRSLLGSVLAHNGANTLVEVIAAIRF
jgi:uncharacterized protein